VRKSFTQFMRDESGATAIEYALIAAFIGLVIITAVTSIGTELKSTFTDIDGGFKSRPQ
jgi:pilus assembly protein Flp/PilA